MTSKVKMKITRDSVVVATEKQVSCELSNELVLLDLNEGMYYGLNQVGRRIWSLVQKPRKVAEVIECVLSEYDVAADRCESDILGLFRELASRGLVEICDGATP